MSNAYFILILLTQGCTRLFALLLPWSEGHSVNMKANNMKASSVPLFTPSSADSFSLDLRGQRAAIALWSVVLHQSASKWQHATATKACNCPPLPRTHLVCMVPLLNMRGPSYCNYTIHSNVSWWKSSSQAINECWVFQRDLLPR